MRKETERSDDGVIIIIRPTTLCNTAQVNNLVGAGGTVMGRMNTCWLSGVVEARGQF